MVMRDACHAKARAATVHPERLGFVAGQRGGVEPQRFARQHQAELFL